MNLEDDQLKKLQTLTIQMAEVFVSFCEEHNLLCYLCGGGCIGAIRHHGMIPWDDDLDFFMPRDDYEKFIKLWKKENDDSRYALEVSDKYHIDGNLFCVLRDRETTYVKPYQENMDIVHGICLDIIPLDGCPSSSILRKLQTVSALVYSLYRSQQVPQNHGKFVSIIAKLGLSLVPSKLLKYKISEYAKKLMTSFTIQENPFIRELCSGPKYMRNLYKKEIFENKVKVPFEDTKMPLPVGFDEYLHIVFGDYMILPPVEQRISPHDVIELDLNRGYKVTQ